MTSIKIIGTSLLKPWEGVRMFKSFLNWRQWRSYISPLLVTLLLTQTIPAAAEQQLVLSTTPDQLISLKANQAPLHLIVEQIARELNIEVQARISDNEIVTDEFKNIPLVRALKRLSRNYIYVTEKSSGKVAKIFLLPQGEEVPLMVTEPRPPVRLSNDETNNDANVQPEDENTASTITSEKKTAVEEDNVQDSKANPDNDEQADPSAEQADPSVEKASSDPDPETPSQ